MTIVYFYKRNYCTPKKRSSFFYSFRVAIFDHYMYLVVYDCSVAINIRQKYLPTPNDGALYEI